MQFREHELLAVKAVADAGAETIDINVREPITALIVRYSATVGAAHLHDITPESCVSRIEIVDGGRVLWSTTGKQAVAAACYERGRWPSHSYNEVPTRNNAVAIPLFFGRWLGDESFAFDPTRYNNPQVKVTWAQNAGHLTGLSTLGVTARLMEGVAAPPQCLFWKSVRSFTGAASGDEPTDMPTDRVWRRLMVDSWLNGSSPFQHISRFKLDCDGGKFIPFDLAQARFREMIASLWPPLSLNKIDVCSTLDERQLWLGSGGVLAIGGEAAGNIHYAWCSGGAQYTYRGMTHAGVALADATIEVAIEGYEPHGGLCYQFGDFEIPESWFPAPAYKGIRLILTQAMATVPIGITLQEAVTD